MSLFWSKDLSAFGIVLKDIDLAPMTVDVQTGKLQRLHKTFSKTLKDL